MKTFSLFLGLYFVAIGSPCFGENKCEEVASQVLQQKGMGTFSHPALGVKKTSSKGPTVKFSALNSNAWLNYFPQGKSEDRKLPEIVSSQKDVFGHEHYFDFSFSQTCDLIHVSDGFSVSADKSFCAGVAALVNKRISGTEELSKACSEGTLKGQRFCEDLRWEKLNDWSSVCLKFGNYFAKDGSAPADAPVNKSEK